MANLYHVIYYHGERTIEGKTKAKRLADKLWDFTNKHVMVLEQTERNPYGNKLIYERGNSYDTYTERSN